ncbi:MAG TPA: desulfoferrodoxin [Candidatus Woesebacteria bacterium]|nr:desulfoferrodoxin [Candidatus Woesebacteria bacterium]
MTNKYQIYRCPICGNVVGVLHEGNGQLVCCGQPMQLLEPKIEDVGFEKHLPVVEKTANGIEVKVGSVAHPMEEGHFIEWIGIILNGEIRIKFLKPNEEPKVNFEGVENDVEVFSYCNLHGLWKS